MFPVRCFTCAAVIGNMWTKYADLLRKGITPKDALDELGFDLICCRRMFISHIDVANKNIIYIAS